MAFFKAFLGGKSPLNGLINYVTQYVGGCNINSQDRHLKKVYQTYIKHVYKEVYSKSEKFLNFKEKQKTWFSEQILGLCSETLF